MSPGGSAKRIDSVSLSPSQHLTLQSIPVAWGGKFFLRKSGGDYICSAQFLAPNIILTAAPCMRDDNPGQWDKDLVFALQDQRGQATQQVTPKCYGMWNKWVHKDED